MVPLYFLFYITGAWTFSSMLESAPVSYQYFSDLWKPVLDADGAWSALMAFLDLCINTFNTVGLPMLLGSIPWALASAFLGYKMTIKISVKHRKNKAEKLGLTYEEYRKLYERPYKCADGKTIELDSFLSEEDYKKLF
jgi:uncharacterized protein (DUF2062 family)